MASVATVSELTRGNSPGRVSRPKTTVAQRLICRRPLLDHAFHSDIQKWSQLLKAVLAACAACLQPLPAGHDLVLSW